MLKRLKINTAWLICLTFIFRLLFVNFSLASTSTSNRESFIKYNFSTILKKRKQIDAPCKTNKGDFSVVEINEEEGGDDDDKLTNPLLLVATLYSVFENGVVNALKKIIPSGNFVSALYSNRYLQFQVIRI